MIFNKRFICSRNIYSLSLEDRNVLIIDSNTASLRLRGYHLTRRSSLQYEMEKLLHYTRAMCVDSAWSLRGEGVVRVNCMHIPRE